jgi:hypothetical protein
MRRNVGVMSGALLVLAALVMLMMLSAPFTVDVGRALQATSLPTNTAVPSAIPTVFGDPAPASINDALADLSRRTGRTITLASFDNPTSKWEWKDVVWTDTGFECPAAGRASTPQAVPGYQFLFTLLGVDYDYRVARDDRTTLILCSSSRASVRPGPVAVAGAAGAGTPAPGVCPDRLPGRLVIGKKGRVTPGLANRLRADSSYAAAIVGRIPGGAEFEVVGGPKCDGGSRFWQVNYAGQVGWTAEGFGSEYWLEPIS